VIDLVGTRANAVSFADQQLVVTEGGRTVANLDFAGHYTTGEFSPSPDGDGGTEITLVGASATAAGFRTMRG
jgi:hypothetical protein